MFGNRLNGDIWKTKKKLTHGYIRHVVRAKPLLDQPCTDNTVETKPSKMFMIQTNYDVLMTMFS